MYLVEFVDGQPIPQLLHRAVVLSSDWYTVNRTCTLFLRMDKLSIPAEEISQIGNHTTTQSMWGGPYAMMYPLSKHPRKTGHFIWCLLCGHILDYDKLKTEHLRQKINAQLVDS